MERTQLAYGCSPSVRSLSTTPACQAFDVWVGIVSRVCRGCHTAALLQSRGGLSPDMHPTWSWRLRFEVTVRWGWPCGPFLGWQLLTSRCVYPRPVKGSRVSSSAHRGTSPILADLNPVAPPSPALLFAARGRVEFPHEDFEGCKHLEHGLAMISLLSIVVLCCGSQGGCRDAQSCVSSQPLTAMLSPFPWKLVEPCALCSEPAR